MWWLGSNVWPQWWSGQPYQSSEEVLSFLLIKGWNWTSRTIEMKSLLVHCCRGHESTSKNVPGVFSRTLPHHMGPKRFRSNFQTFRECSTFHYQRGMASSPPDLNPLDFGNWSYLESKVSIVHHLNLEALKVRLRKEWAKITQKIIREGFL